MDLALLGRVGANSRNDRERTTTAFLAVAGVAALDLFAATQVGKRSGSLLQGRPDDNGRRPGAGGRDNFEEDGQSGRSTGSMGRGRNTEGGVNTGLDGARAKSRSGLRRTTNVITVNRPTEEVYEFWRNFENLPRFMEHLVSVRVDSPMRSHWEAKAPAGRTVEWDAEIVNEVPNEIIAWKSVGEPDVPNAGSVNFSDAPGGRGTIVRVTLDYEPPAGRIGALLSHFFSEEPDHQIREDLRKFKQLMETGEITTSARRVEDSAYVGATPQA
jgi:uncharacterized membrane protein